MIGEVFCEREARGEVFCEGEVRGEVFCEGESGEADERGEVRILVRAEGMLMERLLIPKDRWNSSLEY